MPKGMAYKKTIIIIIMRTHWSIVRDAQQTTAAMALLLHPATYTVAETRTHCQVFCTSSCMILSILLTRSTGVTSSLNARHLAAAQQYQLPQASVAQQAAASSTCRSVTIQICYICYICYWTHLLAESTATAAAPLSSSTHMNSRFAGCFP
jgi:hypothetical protein